MGTEHDAVTEEQVEELRRSLYADLLTFDQTCTALAISRYSLSRWVSSGRLPAVQIGARRYIPHSAIAKHIAGLRDEATRQAAARRSTKPARAHSPAMVRREWEGARAVHRRPPPSGRARARR